MKRYLSALLLALALCAPLASPAGAQEREASPTGWLGISFSPAEGQERAVVIRDVFPGSPADRAGLQEGDSIVRWQGRKDVVRALGELRPRPGERVRLRIRRGGGSPRDLVVVAAARPPVRRVFRRLERDLDLPPHGLEMEARILADSLAFRADTLHRRLRVMLRDSLGHRLRELESFPTPEMRAHLREMERAFGRELGPGGVPFGAGVGSRAIAGAEFTELNPELATYFGTERGALVLRVGPGTPAERSGLRAGDVVVSLDGRPVRGAPDVRRGVVQAQGSERRQVDLRVVRKGRNQEVTLRW